VLVANEEGLHHGDGFKPVCDRYCVRFDVRFSVQYSLRINDNVESNALKGRVNVRFHDRGRWTLLPATKRISADLADTQRLD
jgi:hypothetical protein